MNAIGIAVLVVGIITTLIGGIRFLLAAFEEGVWWGLGVLFVPVVPPIFLILRFGEAWRPALTFVAGFALILVGSFLRAAATVHI